ncbi:MAG: glutamate 5-kinase [Bacteroidetes bacterium]|jgi:glutamate 5-kinase|nr:glutamate 5-kinase [Bacteroidota bacterium]
MNQRKSLTEKRKIVVKIGTSTLSYPNGRLNFRRIEKLAYVLSAIKSNGKDVLLVSSGAIGVGAGRLGWGKRPAELSQKQAMAALGQAELIKIYQKFFEAYNQMVAQVLLTKDVMTIPNRNENACNTLEKLMEMGIIPIINENDTIATDEIEFGDNDTLSAYVARLVSADLLIMLSDIDGLYSADPRIHKDAKIISTVSHITPEIEEIASGSGSSFGTGGMATKIAAAKICAEEYIDAIITNGEDPEIIFKILKGDEVGTFFCNNKSLVER